MRDLKATARLLHVDEPDAALLVETAAAAGLLAQRADGDGDAVWVPTDAFDRWSAREHRRALGDAGAGLAEPAPAPRRWSAARDEADKPRNALAPA